MSDTHNNPTSAGDATQGTVRKLIFRDGKLVGRVHKTHQRMVYTFLNTEDGATVVKTRVYGPREEAGFFANLPNGGKVELVDSFMFATNWVLDGSTVKITLVHNKVSDWNCILSVPFTGPDWKQPGLTNALVEISKQNNCEVFVRNWSAIRV